MLPNGDPAQDAVEPARQRPGNPMRGPGMATRTQVLVVEDEPDIAGLIKHGLERGGDFQAEIVGSGDAALKAVTERAFDLVLLDLNLPVLSGIEVCRILRARPGTARVPIVMLTARTSENDRVTGLDIGADDYITKPFSLRELTARVRAVLRRGQSGPPTAPPPTPLVYRGKHIVADFDAVAVSVQGEPIRLTRREFELLHYFITNRNRVISRDRLLEQVWGYDRDVETRSVDVHVGRLRGKLGPAGRQIETVVGLGYRFVEQTQKRRSIPPSLSRRYTRPISGPAMDGMPRGAGLP